MLETEESVRRDVARELHDDIGQTITAIRTQAGIVQRLAADNASVKQSGQLIEQLSLGVYDAVRRLLGGYVRASWMISPWSRPSAH